MRRYGRLLTVDSMDVSQSVMTPAMHQIPVGGNEPLHWAHGGCWCFPLQQFNDEVQTMHATHNAQDCREALERQGIYDPSRPWVTVLGMVESEIDSPCVQTG